MGNNAHPLMHNHTDDGLRFGYPLVQYKVNDGKVCIVAFDEAGEHLLHYFKSHESISVIIHKKQYDCKLERARSESYNPIISELPYYYSIVNYLPLTDDNVQEYDGLMALTDMICFLENILTGNILSFLKGIGHFTEERIVTVITEMEGPSTIKYKGVHFRSFNLHFVSNVLLPSHIGLGKSTSIGMGTLQRMELPEKFKNYLSQSNEKS